MTSLITSITVHTCKSTQGWFFIYLKSWHLRVSNKENKNFILKNLLSHLFYTCVIFANQGLQDQIPILYTLSFHYIL